MLPYCREDLFFTGPDAIKKEDGNRQMKQGDASFTFLSRIGEIERNLQDERWQSALALALTLPDICGGIEYPELVKRYRDGRVMPDRNGEPARDVGNQYVRWFDEYAAEYFKRRPDDRVPYLTGQRCWQLRCEYLHQNRGFVNEDGSEETYFHLGINCGTSVCAETLDDSRQEKGHIRLDIQQMCFRMCVAARKYYKKNCETKDFSLYHTPVLDFVQWASRGEDIGKTIAVVCSDRDYGRGIMSVLRSVSSLTEVFRNPESAKAFLQKKRPAVWIITSEMLEQKNQPWKADNVPVIVLSGIRPEMEGKKYTWVPVPFSIDALRTIVRERLE